jgi:hypothetical protein
MSETTPRRPGLTFSRLPLDSPLNNNHGGTMLLLTLALFAQTQAQPVHCGSSLFDHLRSGPRPPAVAKTDARPPVPGEMRTMWLWNMSIMPPQQYQTNVTCRGVGAHCYVMVEDSAWDAGQMDSTDVARIIERFDRSSPRDSLKGVWDHNTSVLGVPPDAIDNDSLIYLMYYDVGTFHGIAFDGFWYYFDEYYDTTSMRRWGYHSNEVECVYIDCYPNDPSSDYRVAIAAHEFTHMIVWNYDQAESSWVSEGAAELAMWLFGSPDQISGFPGRSDNDLTRFDGSWNDYIKTYLYFLFIYNQYEQRGGAAGLVHNVVASPFASIEGIDSAFAASGLPERFPDLLDHWVLTNRINDSLVLAGRYAYYGERVPNFSNARFHNSYPVNGSENLSRWAGEYINFRRGLGLELGFDGADAAAFSLYVVAVDTLGHRVRIDTVALDSLNRASVPVPGADTAYQLIYLVPVSHTPTGTMSYTYTATAAGIAEAWQQPLARLTPSFIRAGARLELPEGSRLYSADGRLLAGPGRHRAAALAAGIYTIVERARSVNRRLVVVGY